jgi:hypothetical protein
MDDADVQQGLHEFERMLAHSRDLPELEERIQQGLYRDYVETGEALAESANGCNSTWTKSCSPACCPCSSE